MKELVMLYGVGHGDGTSTTAYAVPQGTEVCPVYAVEQPGTTMDDWGKLLESFRGPRSEAEMRAILKCLVRVEEKLDELLRRTAPEASVVEEIRRRVNEALDAMKAK